MGRISMLTLDDVRNKDGGGFYKFVKMNEGSFRFFDVTNSPRRNHASLLLEGETKDDVSSAGSICTYGSPTKGSWRMKDFGSLTLMVGGSYGVEDELRALLLPRAWKT